jgi:hypothetical protein
MGRMTMIGNHGSVTGSRTGRPATETSRWAAYGIFALLLLVNVDRAVPLYDWDLIGYVAVANSFTMTEPQRIHAATYQSIQRAIPVRQFASLTDPDDAIRSAIAQSPDTLFRMLPLYAVKPLYPSLMFGLGFLGLSYVDASTLISKIAYVGTAIVVALWLGRRLNPLAALLAAGLVISFPPLVRLAQYSTPDSVSVFVALLAFYLAVELRKPATALFAGVIAITARPDNIAFFLPLALALLAYEKSRRLLIGSLASLGIVTYVLQSVLTNNPGWKVTFYRTFVTQDPMAGLTGEPVPLSLGAYFDVLAHQYKAMLLTGDYVIWFLLLGAVGLWQRARRCGLSDGYAMLLAVSLVNIGIHLAAFPRELDRFLIGAYTAIALSSIVTAANGRARRGDGTPRAEPSG